MPDPVVSLHVDDVKVAGWTSISIRKSIEQVCDEFTLELTNQRINSSGFQANTVSHSDVVEAAQAISAAIEQGDDCEVQIDGQTVVTGYAFEDDDDYDANTAQLVVTGSSKTFDLIDSSAGAKGAVVSWREALLTDICFDICKQFNIEVLTVGDEGKAFHRFHIEPGEKGFEAVARACAMRGMLPTVDPTGRLVLCRASTVSTTAVIERGVNVLSGGRNRNRRDVFSTYIFKGQTAASDDWSGESAAQLRNEVNDPTVNRFRPLIVLGQKQRIKEDLGKRAVWERNIRSGKSNRLRYTVPEWTFDGKELWQPNMLVKVKDDWLEIDDEFLVVTVDMLLGDQRVTALELCDPNAFDDFETPPKRGKRIRKTPVRKRKVAPAKYAAGDG